MVPGEDLFVDLSPASRMDKPQTPAPAQWGFMLLGGEKWDLWDRRMSNVWAKMQKARERGRRCEGRGRGKSEGGKEFFSDYGYWHCLDPRMSWELNWSCFRWENFGWDPIRSSHFILWGGITCLRCFVWDWGTLPGKQHNASSKINRPTPASRFSSLRVVPERE